MIKLNKLKNLSSEKLLYEKMPEFDKHSLVVELNNPKAKLKGYIAIHRKKKFPSFGATRFWDYKSKKKALEDVLRLSKLMSYKCAMAGLPYGGAKAVIIRPKGKFDMEKLLEAYAEELNKLDGKFVTGTDVGLSVSDLHNLKKHTEHLVGFSSNPEEATAIGIANSLSTSLNYLYRNNDYSKYSFAIQGVGKVGGELLNILVSNGAKNIYIADIDKKKIKEIKNKYPFVKCVSPNKIYSQKVDVYCPCALSGALNGETIKKLKCKIIVGSANNQLENKLIGAKLHEQGILYTPDYIVNSGGLISVVDEFRHGKSNKERLLKDINKISTKLKKILEESNKKNTPPVLIAEKMSLLIFNKNKKNI